MALKIIKASDPIRVERLNICLYAPPGVGKTSLSFTADDPLLLDFDEGAHRSGFRKDSCLIHTWKDVDKMDRSDFEGKKTVVVDTVGKALDKLTVQIIEQNPKMRGYGGALTLPGFGVLKTSFIAWLKMLQSYGLDIVMLCHSEEKQQGDATVTRLDVQGGSKGEIYKAADAMGWLYIQDNKRVLNFSPTEATFGKNPGQLPVLTVPDFNKEPLFLAGIIKQIKDKLNEGSQKSTEEQMIMDEWRERFNEFQTAEEFNKSIPEIKDKSENVRTLWLQAGKSRGFHFDQKAKKMVGAS